MGERVVLALGGNALVRPSESRTFDQQLRNAREIAEQIAAEREAGTEIILAHGNGPQVGDCMLRNDAADSTAELPLFALGAESQGFIGATLLLAFEHSFRERGLDCHAVPLLTPVVVSADHCKEPIKPVGPFYSEHEARDRQQSGEGTFVEDAGRGWRRVVPSPDPERVPIAGQIERIAESGNVPIAVGGGGLPVVPSDDGLDHVDGVIDKDLAAAQLATQLNADQFIILTDVSHVALNFGTPEERALESVDCETARRYQTQGHFQRGSMYEKVEAVCRFVESGSGTRATITSLNHCAEALSGTAGTQFHETESEAVSSADRGTG